MRCLKIAALAMMLVLTVASRLAAEEPQITSVFPLGGKQGTSLEVELRGHDLETSPPFSVPHVPCCGLPADSALHFT